MRIGASTCRAASAFQYAVDAPIQSVCGAATVASSSHDPKYKLLLADAAGADVAEAAVAGDTVAAAAAAAPFPFLLLCPGADPLLPCAEAVTAVSHTSAKIDVVLATVIIARDAKIL